MTMEKTAELEAIKREVKQRLLIDRLQLEDMAAEDIGDDLILFGEGLGLDSVEAFEVMVGLEELYGIMAEHIPADELRERLATVQSITQWIADSRETAEG